MFPCKQCGCCCRNVGKMPWGKAMALPNGICKYLNQQTNLCTIYAKRPLVCNVDAYYDAFIKDSMDRETFYKLNVVECEK